VARRIVSPVLRRSVMIAAGQDRLLILAGRQAAKLLSTPVGKALGAQEVGKS
jgi:hypothetical protein